MKEHEKSRVWLFGDNVNTDLMSPGYTWNMEWSEAKKHILVNHPRFAPEVREGDIIVAGDNFGCGSSREHAPLAIKSCGVKCVIAHSFARIFYRNAINIGFPIMECAQAAEEIQAGDQVEVDFATGVITDETTGKTFQAEPFPPFIQKIIADGGLMKSLTKK